MRTASAGHLAFAAVLVALGVQGLVHGDFTSIWQPVPAGVPGREALAYACALLFVAAGLGLLFRRTAPHAARALLAVLVLWFLVFRVPVVFRKPLSVLSWDGCAETGAIVAGVWALYARFASDFAFATGNKGLRIARVLFGLALLPFGLAHLAYIPETAALVPAWLPGHVAWAYLTGGTFLVAGVAVLAGIRAHLAASLAALQIGLFTLLVWVPIVAAGSKDAFQWSEFAISCALTAAAWVAADSYRALRSTTDSA
ncbi:MAG TPA: hypothetical protein VGI39_17055 [Polyangiaceae bacterium]|jgi:uncharacterized membrane protein